MGEREETKAIELWADFLVGELSEQEHEWLQGYLKSNPELKAELEEQRGIWNRFDALADPNPESRMDDRFYQWLGSVRAKQHGIIQSSQPWRVGIAASLVGFLLGFLLFFEKGESGELSELTSEVSALKEMMVISLIEQPNALDRIRAVSMSEGMRHPNDKIVAILHHTLITDANVNVRLAALETLMDYWENPSVRSLVIQSISIQDSPIVQSAIADAMLDARAKESTAELRSLLDNPATHELVKEKLTMTIEQLKSI